VGPDCVVVSSPALDDDLGFAQSVEDLWSAKLIQSSDMPWRSRIFVATSMVRQNSACDSPSASRVLSSRWPMFFAVLSISPPFVPCGNADNSLAVNICPKILDMFAPRQLSLPHVPNSR